MYKTYFLFLKTVQDVMENQPYGLKSNVKFKKKVFLLINT